MINNRQKLKYCFKGVDVNIRRYTCAAVLSVGVHAAVVHQLDEDKAFAMPVGTQTNTLSLQFVTMASSSVSKNKSITQKTETLVEQKPAKETQSKHKKPKDKKVTKTPIAKPKSAPIKEVTPVKPTPKKANISRSEKPKVQPSQHKTSKTITKPEVQKNKIKREVIEQSSSPAISAKKGVSEQPVLIEQPSFLAPPTKPRYPRLAQRRGIEGTAMYEIWLDENGNQIRQNLLSSSGASMLDEAALQAIKKWKFSPRKHNGTSIAHRVQVPIRFKLD